MRSDTSYPDPWVQEGQKGGPVGFWSLSHPFLGKPYQTKVAGHPQLSGGRSPYRAPNPDQGPVCFWSHGASYPRRVYKIKVVVYVPNGILPIVHDHREGHWPGEARRALEPGNVSKLDKTGFGHQPYPSLQ